MEGQPLSRFTSLPWIISLVVIVSFAVLAMAHDKSIEAARSPSAFAVAGAEMLSIGEPTKKTTQTLRSMTLSSPDKGGDAPRSLCGNGICEEDETTETCPVDCPMTPECGNGICEPPEDPETCSDCLEDIVCGDAVCEFPETAETCPEDCAPSVFECNDHTYLDAPGVRPVLGDALNVAVSELGEDDLPFLLADGWVEQNEGSAFPYEQTLDISGCARFSFGTPEIFDSRTPIVHLDTTSCTSSNPMYTYTMDFVNANLSDSPGRDIRILGRTYLVSAIPTDVSFSKLTLWRDFASDIVNVGEERVINHVTIQVLGANTDEGTATIVVDGETMQVEEGDHIISSFSDMHVFVKDIFLQTVPVPTAAVEFIVFADEIVLQNGEMVVVNGESYDGTRATFTSSSILDKIQVALFPNELGIPGGLEDVEYLEAGNYPMPDAEMHFNPLFDPVWMSLLSDFVGLSQMVDDESRDIITYQGTGSKVQMSFANKAEVIAQVDFNFEATEEGNLGKLKYGTKWLHWDENDGDNVTVPEDDYFLLNMNHNPTYTYVVKFTSYSSTPGSEKFDCAVVGLPGDPCDYIDEHHGKITLGGKTIDVLIWTFGPDPTLSIRAFGPYFQGGIGKEIYTMNDAKITLQRGNLYSWGYSINRTSMIQDAERADYTSDEGEIITVQMRYDPSEGAAELYTYWFEGTSFPPVPDMDTHSLQGMTDFGTYAVLDADTYKSAYLYVPDGEVNMLFEFKSDISTDCSPPYQCVAHECVMPPPSIKYRVFVTNNSWTGNLGGLAGADQKCAQAATNAGLRGIWKAWISDDCKDAKERLYHSTFPYVRLDGVTIAKNWDDLTDGSLSSAILVTEYGQNATDFSNVWTATDATGTAIPSQFYCGGWTTPSGRGGIGVWDHTDSGWTYYGAVSCDAPGRLYCFEQPKLQPIPMPVPHELVSESVPKAYAVE